jgi:hypothetical protein
MTDLRDEIAAYDEMRIYDAFDAAAKVAVQRFGRGPYLIRQIGAPPIVLSASVLYQPMHGESSMWIR